jgi:hypothetical protein
MKASHGTRRPDDPSTPFGLYSKKNMSSFFSSRSGTYALLPGFLAMLVLCGLLGGLFAIAFNSPLISTLSSEDRGSLLGPSEDTPRVSLERAPSSSLVTPATVLSDSSRDASPEAEASSSAAERPSSEGAPAESTPADAPTDRTDPTSRSTPSGDRPVSVSPDGLSGSAIGVGVAVGRRF